MLQSVMLRFSVENFCLTASKNFVDEPFRVSLISGIAKFYASESYDTIFRRFFFLSEAKNFAGETFSAVFQRISGSEEVFG